MPQINPARRGNAGTTVKLSLAELRDIGEHVPAPPEAIALCRRAFAEFKSLCLWNERELSAPTIRHIVGTAASLRSEGNMAAYLLAGKMEDASRAAF